MKYRDLQIQTQREAPNNARTEGFAFLVRAGYLTRENTPTQLGEYELRHLKALSADESFLRRLLLRTIGNDQDTFFPISTGTTEVVLCPECNYTEMEEHAQFQKNPLPQEKELLLEKVLTPECPTIEALANFLSIPKEKTAKALMYTRVADGRFIFVVIRGDMQLSETKLKANVGNIRAATTEEIIGAGAVPGYASPVGLKDALIVVDDLIPQSQNLVAGANEAGYHLKNTNYGRDYSADVVADLVQVEEGHPCLNCGRRLVILATMPLASGMEYDFDAILLALAQSHHDEKGLTIPHPAAVFSVYLMHIPGKELDTRAKAEEIHNGLHEAGISILFDDRDERAGVKFNDADLIGCPIRVTVGEKGLKDGMVELKLRKEKEGQLILIDDLRKRVQFLLS
jgi:prolyl-tRNA synthetase